MDGLRPDLIPLVISALAGLAYAALGYLGGIWAYEKGRTEEKRAKHLDALKDQVLRPMLTHLTEEVIPILDRRLGNVGICQERAPHPSGSVMESSFVVRQVFCYQVIAENFASRVPEENPEPPAAFLESSLYRHAKEHFPQLFQSWDRLLQEFETYNAAWRGYADWLKSEYARAIPLPEYEDYQQQRWMKGLHLALFAMYRQVGVWTFPPFRRQDRDLEVLEYAGGTLARGTPNEIDLCISTIETLVAQREQVDRLLAQAGPLRDGALKVKAEVEDYLHRLRLPGKCKYLA